MHSSSMRHRWMLAVPVVLAVVGLTVREGLVREVPGAAIRTDALVQADSGAQYDKTDDTIDLRSGGLLAYAPGIATIQSNGWSTIIWGGAAYVSAERGGVTVVAFDVPLIVDGERGTAIVQPGTQWTSPQEALPNVVDDPVGWRDAIHSAPVPEHFLREKSAIIDGWKEASSPSPTELSASILSMGTNAELARVALESGPSKALAGAIRSRSELRFYGLLQPMVRDMAWGYYPENADVDASALMGLMLLPRLEGDASSALTARKWGEALTSALRASNDPIVASAMLTAFEGDILHMGGNGYPLRALQFADAVEEAYGSGATLSADALAALGRLSAMTPETLRASVLSDIGQIPNIETLVPVAVPEPVIVVADPALEGQARDMLAAKGGMFTSDSSVRTVAPGVVDVEAVVFGLAAGDRALRFRYTPATDTVQAFLDGAIQPYPVPWQSYIEWETGR